MNQSQIIGTKIKKQRLYHKMTLKQLSDATGLSIGYLSQVERGLGKPACAGKPLQHSPHRDELLF